MDEPFGAVDPINRESIQNEFFQMQRQLKKTVIMVSHDIDEAIKLGDRVAVFRRGKLVQYDHPDTLLAHPKDEFVGAFVGADSTLKRLLLVKAGDAATQPDTARPDTVLATAYQMMEESDNRYLTVLDGDRRALGYVQRRVARNGRGPCADALKPFATTVSVDDNLRIVLSKMYQFNSSWMPVIDSDGLYVGEVTQDSIADYLSSGRSRRQTGQAAIVSPAVAAAEASNA
jgi:osmoprotectant transport system ATP-binding protein